MSDSKTPAQRRFTIIEVVVFLVVAGLFAGITVPVLLDDSENPLLSEDTTLLREAVRQYQVQTGIYPTLGAASAPGQESSEPWQPGAIPLPSSQPAFAGIDFNAGANDRQNGQRVRFYPDVLSEKPRHSDETAADGTRRWRIDSEGSLSIEMDGRSY